MADLKYQSGFGNEFATEAAQGALPRGQNSPQQAPLGLYAEQYSGTAFTVPRGVNRRTWCYRIRPSVTHKPFEEIPARLIRSGPFDEIPTPPNQLRWDPMPIPENPTDFVDGIVTRSGSGDPATQTGVAIHIYAANRAATSATCTGPSASFWPITPATAATCAPATCWPAEPSLARNPNRAAACWNSRAAARSRFRCPMGAYADFWKTATRLFSAAAASGLAGRASGSASAGVLSGQHFEVQERSFGRSIAKR